VYWPTSEFTRAAVVPSWLAWFSSGFGTGQGTGFGQSGGFGPTSPVNPYANPPGFGAPPPKKSNTWIWILGIIGVGGLLVCGCCGGLSWWGFSQGTQMMAEFAKQEVQDHPKIQEHLGGISSASMNFVKSTTETEKHGTGANILVIEVKGNNGKSAELLAEQSKQPQPGQMFEKIDLRLDSGEVISIK
jgi:hypothetical protein